MNICIRLNKPDHHYENEFNKLKQIYRDVNIFYKINEKEIDLTDVDVFISSRILLSELNTANKLKAIIIPFTGVNQLPLEELKQKNIQVVNSHAHAKYVAEKAFTLGLSLLSRVVELHNRMTEDYWVGKNLNSTWTSIMSKRCGIIGMGSIGQHIIHYLKPFKCEVVTLNRYQEKLVEIDKVITYETIQEVCMNSDIIFVSLPLTKDTHHIINKSILSQMKGKYLVNVGRGPIIEEEGLYRALKEDILAGAAIDVWYNYPKDRKEKTNPSQYPFHELNNVILSPHCAGHEVTSSISVIHELVDIVTGYIKTNKFKNIIDYQKEY